MNQEIQVSECKKCGSVLYEPKYNKKLPCPVCGDDKRNIYAVASDGFILYQQMRMKGKHGGKGKPYFEARAGADYYYDEGKWNYLEQHVDRDNDLFIKIIKDIKTGEILREERKSLRDHRDHGSAKKRKNK